MTVDPNTPLPPHLARLVGDRVLLDLYERQLAQGERDVAMFVSMLDPARVHAGPRGVVLAHLRQVANRAPYYAGAVVALGRPAVEAGKLREGFWLVVSSYNDGHPCVDALAFGVFDGERAD